MTREQESAARTCADGAEAGTLTFPQIVRVLHAAGFDGYSVDLRRATICYYLPNGDTLVVDGVRPREAVGEQFLAAAVSDAIREAQIAAPGYTYRGFCDRVATAGCAGYLVSLPGRRVLYYGRTGDTHTEYFPDGLIP